MVPPVVRCLKCFRSASKPQLCQWLRSGPCPHAQQSAIIGGPAGSIATWAKEAMAGSLEGFHSSHHMKYKGIWWCSRCGSFSVRAGDKVTTRHLKSECPRQPAAAGAYQLRRLRRGLPPGPHLKWTEDLGLEAMWVPKHRLRQKTARVCSPPIAMPEPCIAQQDPAECHPERLQEPGETCAQEEQEDPFGFAHLDSFA